MRWIRTELDRRRGRDAIDPLVEGARYQLAREVLLAIWAAACEAADDGNGRHDAVLALQRFHGLAARIAARGGRLHPNVGRLTLVDTELQGFPRSARDEL